MLSGIESSKRSPTTFAQDLALIGRAQDHLDPPRGFALTYDALFSSVCGVFVGAQALPLTIRPFATIVVVLSLIALMLWWRRRIEWWLSGFAPRRARWVTFAMLVPLLGLMFWAWAMPMLWVAITAGITAAAVAFAASRLWARVWKRELLAARNVA